MPKAADPLARLRKIALALPEAHEVKAWGEPTFRVNNKLFAMYAGPHTHHGAGRPGALDQGRAGRTGAAGSAWTPIATSGRRTSARAAGSASNSTAASTGAKSPISWPSPGASPHRRSCSAHSKPARWFPIPRRLGRPVEERPRSSSERVTARQWPLRLVPTPLRRFVSCSEGAARSRRLVKRSRRLTAALAKRRAWSFPLLRAKRSASAPPPASARCVLGLGRSWADTSSFTTAAQAHLEVLGSGGASSRAQVRGIPDRRLARAAVTKTERADRLATAEGLKPRDLLPRRGEGACPPLV